MRALMGVCYEGIWCCRLFLLLKNKKHCKRELHSTKQTSSSYWTYLKRKVIGLLSVTVESISTGIVTCTVDCGFRIVREIPCARKQSTSARSGGNFAESHWTFNHHQQRWEGSWCRIAMSDSQTKSFVPRRARLKIPLSHLYLSRRNHKFDRIRNPVEGVDEMRSLPSSSHAHAERSKGASSSRVWARDLVPSNGQEFIRQWLPPIILFWVERKRYPPNSIVKQ